jgi:hypothetical protein
MNWKEGRLEKKVEKKDEKERRRREERKKKKKKTRLSYGPLLITQFGKELGHDVSGSSASGGSCSIGITAPRRAGPGEMVRLFIFCCHCLLKRNSFGIELIARDLSRPRLGYRLGSQLHLIKHAF